MTISVNRKSVETSAATLAALVAELALPAAGVAVAVNQKIVTRTAWPDTPLREGDEITVIKAACGG